MAGPAARGIQECWGEDTMPDTMRFVRFMRTFRTRKLADLRRRINATRWPEREPVSFVRSKHDNALPLIVTHGWPGSVTRRRPPASRALSTAEHAAALGVLHEPRIVD